MTNPLTELPDFANPENNYMFCASESISYGDSMGIVIDTGFNANLLYNSGGDKNFLIRAASPDIKINIADLRHGRTFYFGFTGSDTNLTIENVLDNNDNGIIWFGTANSYIKSFEVTGTFYVRDHTTASYHTAMYACGVENHGIDNPDGKINILSSVASDVNRCMLYYAQHREAPYFSGNINRDSYVRINSITSRPACSSAETRLPPES